MEKLKLAVESQNFYYEQCLELEKKVDADTRYIVNTDPQEWSKEKFEKSLEVCGNLMISSAKLVKEAENILNSLSGLTKEEYESDVETVGEIAVTTRSIMRKQKEIYSKLIDLQGILIDIIERF